MGGEKGDEMSELEQYDTAELEAELRRREIEDKERAKPKPLRSQDWSIVEQLCIGYVEAIASTGWPQKDSKQYIFEEAMKAVYGHTVWAWINDNTR